MDTNRLKRFATEARNILIQGVAHRLQAIGFDANGNPIEEPQLFSGGATFMGDTVSTDFYDKWQSLARAIRQRSMKEVAEEVAYTWFNRLMAIRIMVKNNLIPPVLQYESEGVFVPLLVTEARQGRLPVMQEDEHRKLMVLLDDDSKTAEQFAILIVAFCHATPVINACFGSIKDYTELLLPTNILAEGGFVDLINHTDFISEKDYKSPELIGWLYQFYISEKKDFIINSGKKAEIEDIPARTQLFTPNWIVKYMVHNSLGRIYIDNNPYSKLVESMDYYISSEKPTPAEAIFHFDDVHELTCADLACGSGHILNEAFDILYKVFLEEGYSRRKAIEDIFLYNLIGVDIDTRAKQLAQFALLLKACQKDSSFVDAHVMPRVMDMPKPYPDKSNLHNILSHFFLDGDDFMVQEVCDAINLMDNAKNLGSIMKFSISKRTRDLIAIRMEEYRQQEVVPETIGNLIPYMNIILALTDKYATIIMNPPYMGSSYMNSDLKQYVTDNYQNGKSDLFSAFLYQCNTLLQNNGYIGYICPYVWMFISSYEQFRKDLLHDFNIMSLIQLEYNAFEPACVPICTFTLSKTHIRYPGSYIKLSEFKGHQNQAPKTLEAIKNKNCGWYYSTIQNKYSYIPGSPIGYWLTDRMFNSFKFTPLNRYGKTTKGIITGDNAQFIRNWHEISHSLILFTANNYLEASNSKYKWFPCNKGGGMRKWYGNNEYIIDWENDGKRVLQNAKKEKRHAQDYFSYMKFRPIISWSSITSNTTTFRFKTNDLVEHAGMGCYIREEENIFYYLGFFSSKVTAAFLEIISPTLNINAGEIESLPFNDAILSHKNISMLVKDCVSISKSDWDSHETSWDFETNPIVAMCNQYKVDGCGANSYRIENFAKDFESEWNEKFNQLHANEVELNRQFIEIYGLQDELTPDVPKDEITILQQGEISIEEDELNWHKDVIMKQLISYAVGCMMGRYSIDKPGLILANQGDNLNQYNELVPNSRFEADDDGIIPLMSAQSDFADNATVRFKNWLTVTFGEEMLVDNLNFIEKALGKSIDDYFVKDFWKDHKKMYQNRPIYWLFSSKKGAFQCLAYMHRMDAYTAERIRTKYLLPHIEWLMQKQGELEANAANLTNIERKQLDSITKQITECREYHDRLHVVADQQIAFDLDDGVVVNYAKFGDVLSKIK